MAKPNPNDPLSRKKQAEPSKEQDEEKDKEGADKDANDNEQKQNTEQNTLGNQALQSQMIGADPGAPGGSGEGGGGGLAMRRAAMDSEVSYGGDGDGGSDLPLTLEDLVRSWNPGTSKSKDRPSWLEPMPSDELPPEDLAYLERIREDGPRRITAGFTLDAQLQPSIAVIAASLLDWSHEAMQWCGHGLLERSMAQVVRAGSSFIQDPHGRALNTRARMATIGSLMLQASPALAGTPGAADVAFLRFCLELAGHKRHAEMVRIDPGIEGKQMPKSNEVFERCFEGPPRTVEPRPLSEGCSILLRPVLEGIFDMEDPHVYLPTLEAEPEDPDDDPLGLDALLAELTGGATDPEDALYYAALQAAERIAAATARTRVHTAALAVTIAQVARQYSSGSPTETLKTQCRTLDGASDKTLRLLVEIARAAQKRNVPPRGLKAGLTRAVRGLRGVHQTTLEVFSAVIGGILPGQPSALPTPPDLPTDPLSSAWLDGRPAEAIPWLTSLDDTPEHRAAILLHQAAAGDRVATLGPAMIEVASELPSPHLAAALRVFASPCLVAGGHTELALAVCEQHLELATRRRNGALLTDAALTGMEANPADADALWHRAGRLAFQLGDPGALTMLARYRPAQAGA